MPIAVVELAVAGVSLVLGIGAALYIGRTIVRPVRLLEATMHRVELGDLRAEAPVVGNDEIGHLASAFNRMIEGLRREVLVRDLFGQYVSPEVARVAIDQRGQLEPQVVECSVVFVDIRGFTGLTDVLSPHELMSTLNVYFDRLSEAVASEGGLVNKFGGDSLLAVFGSPLNPSRDHAARAVRATLAMRSALDGFNRDQVASGKPELQAGIGVASGELVAGNIGSQRKLEYTVIGDPVNLAARLQELTSELGTDVLVSAETARLAEGTTRLASLGEVEVRGRARPVGVFTPA